MSSQVNPTVRASIDSASDEMSAPNSMVFDGQRSRRGYRLNRFTHSLRVEENRAAFSADPAKYMSGYGLTAEEQSLVLNQDWLGLVKSGANIYTLVKLTGSVGSNLLKAGLQMRGEEMESFKRSRPINKKEG